MDYDKALVIIDQLQERFNLPLLETLVYIDNDISVLNTTEELNAFNVVMNGFRKLIVG